MLQIGTALSYYKLGQTLLQIGAASLLQIRASVITNWGSYYKLGQPLLQNRAAITNWGRYYKLGQLLQIEASQLPQRIPATGYRWPSLLSAGGFTEST